MNKAAIESSIAEAIIAWERRGEQPWPPDGFSVAHEAQRRMFADPQFNTLVRLHAQMAIAKMRLGLQSYGCPQ